MGLNRKTDSRRFATESEDGDSCAIFTTVAAASQNKKVGTVIGLTSHLECKAMFFSGISKYANMNMVI